MRHDDILANAPVGVGTHGSAAAKITVRFAVTEAVLGRRRSAIPHPFGWPCLNRPFEPDLTDPYREFASR